MHDSHLCTQNTMGMHPSIFSYSSMGFILLSLFLVIYTGIIWQQIKKHAPIPMVQTFKPRLQWFAGIYFIAELIICVLAARGFFSTWADFPRFILVMVPFMVTLIVLVPLKANPHKITGLLQYLHPAWFIFIQAFRIPVEMILADIYTQGMIPVELTWHGRNMDIMIGPLAIITGIGLYIFPKKQKLLILGFNISGLLSLINILTIVIPSMPTPFRQYELNLMPTYFPGVLIMFLAPMAVYIHIVSIKQILLPVAPPRGG